MSDNESTDRVVEEHEEVEDVEEEDLFGDVQEEEEEEEDNDNSEARSKRSLVDEDDEEEENDEDDDEEEVEEVEHDLKYTEISLPRHAESAPTEDEVYSLKLPVFLNVEAHPFDPTEFKEKVEQNAAERSKTSMTDKQVQSELVAEKLLNENTLRWRYSNSGNDEIIKQSNAHFVQWDDGSLSLKIGQELFDVRHVPAVDSYLVKTHDSLEILQFDSSLDKTINLLPASTFTATHRKLTAAVKNIQRKEKILNTITDDDPMRKQRLADENERKTLKLRRQLELKRRLQEERLGRDNSPSLRGTSRETAYERFENQYAEDEYDEEDDFIARDDEEEEQDDDDEELGDEDEEERFEKGAERLQALKQDGAARYREDSEETSERKRRRIVESDEED
ncbi:uncharacterized protein RJT21DRAFT_48261 [Scheffersomyces amazonensis]|uniref:uncharacterized protein n=1 Tax=Scheffersomyces amazonensis TaxID=1078765 RepID=UPI00315C4DA5